MSNIEKSYRNLCSYCRNSAIKHSLRRSQCSVLETPPPLCVAALKSNECAVKFRLFSLEGNRIYIGNARRSHIYSRCKFAAGSCSEELKCLLGARNSRKVVITRPYPGSPGGGVLENSAVSPWD